MTRRLFPRFEGFSRLLRALCLGVLLLALLPIEGTAGAPAGRFKAGSLEPPESAPDFTLQSTTGAPFRLNRQRGSVVVLYFGYTFCPDVCPTTLATLSDVKEKLGPAAKRLRVAMITVDPQRDTLKRLRMYTQAFDKDFLGLTGTPEALATVRKAYGILAQKRTLPASGAGYLVDHSASLLVIDPEGRLRLSIPFGTVPEDILHDLKLLLER